MNEQTSEEMKKMETSGEGPGSSENMNNLSETDDHKELTLEEMSRDDLLKKIKELQNMVDENFDRYVRSQAEIDNILKRNRKEKEEWVKFSNENLIKELLQVIDNLENAIAHSREGKSFDALAEGVELTLKGLLSTLEKAGLKCVCSMGEDFDPSFHHAVLQENDDNIECGKILKELQKGYTLNERLIRPSMVVISSGSAEKKEDNKESF